VESARRAIGEKLDPWRMGAAFYMAMAEYSRGNFRSTTETCLAGLDVLERSIDTNALYGQTHPRYQSLSSATGLAYGMLGRFDLAEQYFLRAIEHARAVSSGPYALSLSHALGAMALIGSEDAGAAVAHAESAIALAREAATPSALMISLLAGSSAHVREGRVDTALAYAGQALAISESITYYFARVDVHYVRALAALARDNDEAALDAVESGLQWSLRSCETKLDAELHRLRGLALRRKDPKRAQESFGIALAIARSQGAAPFEARVVAAMG
jgi:tetratricopeptide (TPR) repeat protein